MTAPVPVVYLPEMHAARGRARSSVPMPGPRLQPHEAELVRAAARRVGERITHYMRRALVERAARDLSEERHHG